MKNLLWLFCAVSLLFSCKKNNSKGGNAVDASNQAAGGNSAISALAYLPSDQITEMNKTCTSIDLVSLIKDVNVSMNFDNPQAVQYVLSFVADEKGVLTGNCPPQGHVTFVSHGNIVNEADIYYLNGCNAMVWTKNQKPIFCNKIAPEGIDFYKNFLRQRSSISKDSVK